MNNKLKAEMSPDQYRRINLYAYNMLIAIYVIIAIIAILSMINGFHAKDLILLFVVLAAGGVNTLAFFLVRERKAAMVIYSLSWMFAYSFTVFLSAVNPIVLLFPVLVVLMLYLDPLAVALSIIYSLVLHIIKLISLSVTGQITAANVNSNILEFIALIAMCIGAYAVTRLLLRYIMESKEQVAARAALQMEVATTVEGTAGTISRRFQEINRQLEEIVQQIEGNNMAITNIAESTEATAEAIQEQLGMTNDIKECIDVTAQNANDIIDTTDQAYDVLSEGIEAVEGLQEQTTMVNEQTNETSEVIEKLAESVDEVNSITKAILDISSQTNLLALNASIEAARAGEAGKGFAVVADEIRNLAEQTKASTEQITSIINDLTNVTKESMGKLKATVDSVRIQTQMVEKVNETFMETCKSIDELKDYTGSISDNVDTVISANTHIIDSISQLSASAEEVSSSSQEGMAVSNVILEQVQTFAVSVQEMSGMVAELATSVSESGMAEEL